MAGSGLLAGFPIWAVFVATLAVVLLSVEGGYRWARYKQRQSEEEKEAPVGAMVGATLGLLAFILAFTFGIAADAFHARKIALVEEANAIRSTFLLAGAVPEPDRSQVRAVLREYVDERLRWTGAEPQKRGRTGEELLGRLWTHAAAVGAQNPGAVDAFLGSVQRVTDLNHERVMVREQSRIPGAFWIVLYGVAVLALAAMGYHGGVAGTTRSPVMVAVAIAFSAVIMLIADLDRPGEGFVNVSQQSMVDLRDWLAESAGR